MANTNTNTSKKSQRTEVLKYIKQYKYITGAKAYEKFGVERIGSVIHDLRKKGVIIETVMVESSNRYGNPTRFGRYYYKGVSNE